jgi:GT2 family glycosyltransferase
MAFLARLLASLPLLIVSPLVMAAAACSLALTDLAWRFFGSKSAPADTQPRRDAASVVIPNWNGRDLLAKYLPYLEQALAANPANEIVVVDNGSTDGSAEFVRQNFPRVKLLALEKNLGFGGGSNAGFRAAENDIVVLLNSDMRVEPDFLAPLLAGFTDEKVFAVSCQIFLTDPDRIREETGLTQGWWETGALRVRHRIDPAISDLYPCFYGGGGSCAFDRRKFLELGGFDSLLAPFYLEDTDLGYMAWKRGWKVLYQPKSVVYHEHRGTIGKRFTENQIQAVLKKNFILFCWKNIHQWGKLVPHLSFSYAGALVSMAFGDELGRPNLAGLWRAFLSLPHALRSRWRARSLAVIDDTEAFRRPLGGYFRDRFDAIVDARQPGEPDRLRVLFVSPYPILPAVHGGGVFMYQTLRELARLAEVHVVALLDYPHQLAENEPLRDLCASAEFLVRMEGRSSYMGSIVPHAVREFQNDDLDWLIHRQIYTRKIDVLQLEYTPLAQYIGAYRRIAGILFEHDIYFQSIARGLGRVLGVGKLTARFEYLRALRYELRMLPRCDRVQVCTLENKEYLASFLPRIRGKLQEGLRAGIDTARYNPVRPPPEPDTMLFLGGFRHSPNAIAVEWFARKVMPHILAARPNARLIVIGSDPPPPHAFADLGGAMEILGFVDNIRDALARYAVFVCPILNGSGVRVKLLEAFAAGIPTVSTYIGAEGLARKDGEFCLLADDPEEFAKKALWLFENPREAAELAARARQEVVANWDMAELTRRLEASYREVLREKRL